MGTKKVSLKMLLLIVGFAILTYCGTSKEQVRKEEVQEVPERKTETVAQTPVIQSEPQTKKTISDERLAQINQKLSQAAMYGFGNGKTKLTAKLEKAWLAKNLGFFKELANELAEQEDYSVEVRGHASSRLAPKPKYIIITRDEAALKRAEYAISLLQKNGVDTSRFVAVSKSDKEPLDAKKPKDAKNRRVTFQVVRR